MLPSNLTDYSQCAGQRFSELESTNPGSPTSTCDSLGAGEVANGIDAMMLDSLSEPGTPKGGSSDVSESDLFNDLLCLDVSPPSPSLGLLNMPDELVCAVLSFLPAVSIINTSRTCKFLQLCANRDELWYWVYHYRWPPRKDRYGRRSTLRYKPLVRCWKEELQLRSDSEATGVAKEEVVHRSWGDLDAAVAMRRRAATQLNVRSQTSSSSFSLASRSPFSASRAAQLDRYRRVCNEARDEWMLWRVVYRNIEDHPDPKDSPNHTCDNTRCTLWRCRMLRDVFVCDETGHVHECNGRTMEDSACDSAMWDRENQCWVCPISMRIFRYAAPSNAAVEQGIEPGGEDFGLLNHVGESDSRGIIDPRAGEGECGEVEGQGGDGGVAVGNKNCFVDWYYQGYEASMADERREAEAERRNFDRMGEARFRGAELRGHRCSGASSSTVRRKRSHPTRAFENSSEEMPDDRPCALRRLL
ncbi:hypothetical protein FOL47_003443 [Perkinsus chesapeaki]|uniref:F-box domain-containing protein n=1 Tax=Perkinsus chesapeaki TaxID=330153 RepID=A0A7J6M909_PERCH|nr:hypothetical protein FOL47_003443 [Perkinsus chesapeaki]